MFRPTLKSSILCYKINKSYLLTYSDVTFYRRASGCQHGHVNRRTSNCQG